MSLAEAMACKQAASFRASCSSRHNFRASEANLGMVGEKPSWIFLFFEGMNDCWGSVELVWMMRMMIDVSCDDWEEAEEENDADIMWMICIQYNIIQLV